MDGRRRDGRFVTQRELPRLALVDTSIVDGRLRLRRRTCRACDVALDAHGAVARRRRVAQRRCAASTRATQPRDWLSDYLAPTCASCASTRRSTRRCNPDYAGDSGAHTLFADGYPLLVIGAASLDDLNERLVANGDTRRCR